MREGWEYKKLGEVAKISSGKAIPSSDIIDTFSEGLYPCYGGNGLRGYVDHFSNDGLVPVIGRVGALCGNVHLPQGKFYATEHALVVYLKTKDKPHYIEYLLSSLNLRQYAKGVAQPVLSASTLSEITVPVPPLSEQEHIVSELDLLSSIIEKKKAQLKEYDQLAQSIFYDMFGDPITNEKGWEVKKLGEVCEIVRGGSPRPIDKFLGGDIPWIKIGDATKGDDIYLYSTKEHIIQEGLNKTRYIPNGSLIFANCGVSLGFARIIKFKGCIHDGWLALMNINVKELNKVFMLKSLNACTMYFRNLAPDGTQPNLNTQIMKGFKQIVPPISLQNDFAGMIEAIQQQKSLVQQSIVETQTMFDYTMDKYFG